MLSQSQCTMFEAVLNIGHSSQYIAAFCKSRYVADHTPSTAFIHSVHILIPFWIVLASFIALAALAAVAAHLSAHEIITLPAHHVRQQTATVIAISLAMVVIVSCALVLM